MTDDALLARLQQEIDEIGRDVPSAKTGAMALNEADTESAVVEPLLRTLGYGRLEFSRQSRDKYDGSRPDYTLLPGTPSQWFLEVKKLNLPLSDSNAAQAVQYAVNQGARWAVLTNGRAWWIYRAHLEKPLSEKRVLEIDSVFDGLTAVRLLAFLSRDAMASDALSAWWMGEQTRQIIRRELENPESPTRQSLRRLVSDTIHQTVSESQIADVLAPLLSPIIPPPPPLPPPPDPVDPGPPPKIDNKQLTLSYLRGHWNEVAKAKPARVSFADGANVAVTKWNSILRVVIEHYGQTKLPPLPLKPSKGFKCLLNRVNTHPNGERMRSPTELQLSGQTVFLEQAFNVYDGIKYATTFLNAINISPDDVTVQLA